MISWTCTRVIIPPFLLFLQKAEIVKRNYRGETVPSVAGVALCISVLVTDVILHLLPGVSFVMPTSIANSFVLLCVGMMSLGLIDDVYGKRDVGGFSGHFGRWIRTGVWSTGIIKALGGGILALVAVFISRLGTHSFFANGQVWTGIAVWLLHAAIISLTANSINLLDVRPGRALKGCAILLLFLVGIESPTGIWIAGMLAGCMIAYAPYDFKALSMLGDAGSNMLGAMIGFMIVTGAAYWLQAAILVGLVTLHIYSEKKSISAGIEQWRWLQRIDQWGRNN